MLPLASGKGYTEEEDDALLTAMEHNPPNTRPRWVEVAVDVAISARKHNARLRRAAAREASESHERGLPAREVVLKLLPVRRVGHLQLRLKTLRKKMRSRTGNTPLSAKETRVDRAVQLVAAVDGVVTITTGEDPALV